MLANIQREAYKLQYYSKSGLISKGLEAILSGEESFSGLEDPVDDDAMNLWKAISYTRARTENSSLFLPSSNNSLEGELNEYFRELVVLPNVNPEQKENEGLSNSALQKVKHLPHIERQLKFFLTEYEEFEELIGFKFKDKTYLLQSYSHAFFYTNHITTVPVINHHLVLQDAGGAQEAQIFIIMTAEMTVMRPEKKDRDRVIYLAI
ncbi:unnamed protein product [Lepeophtheirus salmonis]|uniref:(salmon louse) hypothetical protein n=1 Tax=Lepeophtheirus salmonis TaxID=72036 RepID=A0A7R8CL37_LEPSM|nr:unnamed protein product [Lepeophtheirus salmonis]CAF2853818.1 unnamed protein product [Lepeophtheirus salmonis]